MREKFEDKKLGADSLATIAKANAILIEYQRQGYTLSLRQLYYQMVSRALIPNNLKSYKRLGDIISNGRLAGLIDWAMIEDRGRDYTLPSHWDEPSDIISSAAASYRMDKWADQPWHIEVMCEKDALSGVLEPVAHRLDIGFTANKGYSSSTALYDASKRLLRAARRQGKNIALLYFGDHDPSGLDMTRDIRDRLALFTGGSIDLEVKRLALNMDQVEQYGPPENPAKTTDSRAADYIAEFGESSWELDALEPTVLAQLVEDEVMDLRDPELWKQAVAREDWGRKQLAEISAQFNNVVMYLGIEGGQDEG